MTTIKIVRSLESFKDLFAEFYHPLKYVYISIGSRYHDSTVYFTHPNDGSIPRRTNAPYQLYPAFLQDHSLSPEREILVVSIDHYDDSHIEYNHDVVLSQTADMTNVKVILYDEMLTIQLIPHLFDFLCEVMKMGIPERCMIVNYVRFVNPNHTEHYLEQKLPDAILSALWEPYKSRFYQWFGFHPNLYNIIYCYSRNKYLLKFDQCIRIISKILGNDYLSTVNAWEIHKEIMKSNCKLVSVLWNTFVDIQGGNYSDDICSSFCEIITM